jgi:nicotinamidase/pyrazinamidase
MSLYDHRTALIVVDVQNDFADPAGSLYVASAEQVVEAVNSEIALARAAGALVVYTQDWHPPSTPHFQKDGGIWPDHCVQDTWGAAFHPALDVGGEHIRKGGDGSDAYSGFSTRHPLSGERDETSLGALLRDRGTEDVVVVGLATDYCVKDTALDAVKMDWPTAVLTHAIAAVNLEPSDGVDAVEAMRQAGVQVV